MANGYMNSYTMEDSFIETRGYQFKWNVAVEGYDLVDETLYKCRLPDPNENSIDITPPWIIIKKELSLGRDYDKKVYKPLQDEPVLHRKFGGLDTNRLESEVLRFAKQFGLLGVKRELLHHTKYVLSMNPLTLRIPMNSQDLMAIHTSGESLLRWQVEIENMGVLLAIWDLVRRQQDGKLGQIVVWDEACVYIRFKWRSRKGRYEILALDKNDMNAEYLKSGTLKSDGYGHVHTILEAYAWEESQIFFQQYKLGDVVGPAKYYLCKRLNSRLHGITPSLIPERGYSVSFIPNTLLDALWLMFMLEVDGTVRTCWYCRNPFEPNRKDNVYCSNNCKRMAHYYAKQRKGGVA